MADGLMATTTTVFKYRLAFEDVVEIDLPRGAEALYVAVQHGHLCLWARVNETAPLVRRRFRVAGTGHPLGEVGRHLGSVML
jgi:hypothetical protein